MGKHCCSSDILVGSGELWDIVPLVHDVVLDLTSATPGTTRRAMRMGRNVPHGPCRRRWRLALPPLSLFLGVRLCRREGLRMRVRRGMSLRRLRNHRRLS